MFRKLRQLASKFEFWIILNCVASLGLVLFVSITTNFVVESIDTEDRVLVDAYSDDLRDVNNLNVELHQFNTETLAFILIGDQALLPKIENRMVTLRRMLNHIKENHPRDLIGFDILLAIEGKFEERDAFVHSMIKLRESGIDINDLARRVYVEGRPLSYALQDLVDKYVSRRFAALNKSRMQIDQENESERRQLIWIQFISVFVGLFLALTLGKVLMVLHRKAKTEAELRKRALNIAAHDLKNPISNILGSIELLRTSLDGAKHDEQLTQIIERAANNMKQLVHNYLEVGRLESGKWTPSFEWIAVGELMATVTQTMKPLADQQGILLVNEVLLPLGHRVKCDPQMLLQVFSNLIGNALKFSPPESIISLRVDSTEKGIEFSVTDDGPGIPIHLRAQVFEVYFQGDKKAKGSGLGLSIAKGIIEAHNGHIWADSNGNHGAKMTFVLPDFKEQVHPTFKAPTSNDLGFN